MKIGVLTGIWFTAETADIIQSLRRAAALGFRYVDLHGVYHAGPVHLDQAQRLQVKVELSLLGLTPRNFVLHALKNPAAANDAEQEQNINYLKEGIDLAVSWGINQIMLNPGKWVYGMSRQEAWQRSKGFLQAVCDVAKPRGVFIAQEPEPYVWFIVNDLSSALQMAEDVNRDNFTLLVDFGHMGLCRENAADLEKVKEIIIHAHFSDHKAFLHTNQIIGTGNTPTADYLAALQKLGIDQLVHRFGYDELVVSFELGAQGDKIEYPDDWVRASLQYIRQITPYMALD
jgi:sugar phosphate isomerase/epimerase